MEQVHWGEECDETDHVQVLEIHVLGNILRIMHCKVHDTYWSVDQYGELDYWEK